VILNLLSNAVKFTETGHVSVEVRSEPVGVGRSRLRVEVRDTGIGLSDEAKGRMFQKFEQADSSITRKFGGTGLGLSICRQLVELMGGEIGVGDAAGGGAVFWFELELEASAGQLRSMRDDIAGVRILVVDDIALNRTIFRRQLEDYGARVEEAESGEAAVGAVAACRISGDPIQLVLLDQMMPGMSGETAARLIRESGDDVPMVMASSLGEPMSAKAAAEIGIDAFLMKPVRHEALITTLRRTLGAEAVYVEATAAAQVAQQAVVEDCARVLLAEDNEINVLLARTILEQVGFSVTCVGNGEDAVRAASTEAFDLILMDVQMPVMDGLEATRRIRAKGGLLATVPIVAMTANAMRQDRLACLEAGMNDFVSKPIDAGVFLGVLERLMDGDERAQDAA